MVIRELIPSRDEADWEALVKASPASGFMQSWAWSAFKASQGQTVHRLGLFGDGKLLGGAMVYSVPSRYAPLHLPHGPVLPWGDAGAAAEGYRLLLEKLSQISSDCGAPLARIEPLLEGPLPAFLEKAARAPLDLLPTPTLLVNVAATDEELLSGMTPKGRYNVRLALRKGVEVGRVAAAEGLNDFFELFELTCLRQGFDGETRSFFEGLFEALEAGGVARLYQARYRGMLMAGAVAIFYGRKVTYLYGASSPFLRSAMAPYAMHWHLMREAREAGCSQYDFYGIAPEGAPGHAYARFTAFKTRFGGRRCSTCGAHDIYFYPRLARLLKDALEGGVKGAL